MLFMPLYLASTEFAGIPVAARAPLNHVGMKKDDNKKPAGEKPAGSTEKDLDLARKAIELQKQTSGKPREEAEKDARRDAEKWRNEG